MPVYVEGQQPLVLTNLRNMSLPRKEVDRRLHGPRAHQLLDVLTETETAGFGAFVRRMTPKRHITLIQRCFARGCCP